MMIRLNRIRGAWRALMSPEGTPSEPPVIVVLADPQNEAEDLACLRGHILVLERRARRQFDVDSGAYHEVVGLLQTAAEMGLKFKATGAAHVAIRHADLAFRRNLLTANRFEYLRGVVLGFTVAAFLLYILLFLAAFLLKVSAQAASGTASSARAVTDPTLFRQALEKVPVPEPATVFPLFIFAGMGTFISVFLRLNQIRELEEETDALLLRLSGVARPLIAFFSHASYMSC
jgi:hypothetical protein